MSIEFIRMVLKLEDCTMNNIGIRIKSLRENNNLSQKQFADRIMVSQSYLSRIERGIEIPNNKLIKLIGLEFKVNTDWISEGKGIPDIDKKKLSYDYYDRAYTKEFIIGAQEELQRFSEKIFEYNNAEIARSMGAVCGELINLFDYEDDTLRAIIGEFIGSIILGLCEQLNKFSRDIDLTEFQLLKSYCFDNLYDELKSLEDYIDNRDFK